MSGAWGGWSFSVRWIVSDDDADIDGVRRDKDSGVELADRRRDSLTEHDHVLLE